MEGDEKRRGAKPNHSSSDDSLATTSAQAATPIPLQHPPVDVGGVKYDLGHLNAFAAAIPGKGIHPGTNLGVVVVFSNHVFTERTKHGEVHHTIDHNGTKRTFDSDRFEMSKILASAIKYKIETNDLTYASKSFGGIDNLVLLETSDGRVWTIVYCLRPISNGKAVRMEILSCHPKVVDQRKISRQHLSYFARQCLFEGCRTPKE